MSVFMKIDCLVIGGRLCKNSSRPMLLFVIIVLGFETFLR